MPGTVGYAALGASAGRSAAILAGSLVFGAVLLVGSLLVGAADGAATARAPGGQESR